MVYSISYTRPTMAKLGLTEENSESEKSSFIEESRTSSRSSRPCNGVPQALSFDNIVEGGTCPPCSLRDFCNYLKYIERSAENLQFYLWLRSYEKRFDSLPPNERMLSPEWTLTLTETEALVGSQQPRNINISRDTLALIKDAGFGRHARIIEAEKPDPFGTPRSRGSEVDSQRESSSVNLSSKTSYESADYKSSNQVAYEDAGLKWQPFSIQPYRDEVARIIAVYIAKGAPRQLNISARERTALLHALENTTHPSAFRTIKVAVEFMLRAQSHPHFIRWAIRNGNRPRVIFARGLGIFLIIAGIVTGTLLAISSAGRGWRVFTLLFFFLGIPTLIAAMKGMCVVLHGLHHRHLRPWELFQDDEYSHMMEQKNANSIDTFVSDQSANSFEDEPWVAKYEKRNVVRKVFDRELWIEEPALRQIQDTIFLQAVMGALVGSGVLMAIFVAVPAGKLY